MRRFWDHFRHCKCGHTKDAHEHYRLGSDCSQCDCREFDAH